MSRTIDEKVVEMRFDNSNFESNVKESMSTLDKLKQSLKFEDSAKAFSNIDKAASKVSFSGITNGIEQVQAKFSALDVVSATILNRMTNSVINFGKKIITAIPAQIKSGGINRALNLEQAKFQLKGLKIAWDDVSESINTAVDGTAYGLDAAAKAASQLAASGVKLGDEMTAALRGISGVAAMTNQSYESISPIFTTVAGQGKLMTMQLRQLESRGLNAAATLAKSLGVTEAAVREMVTQGKIDFKTFADAMNDAFGEQATRANETYTGALSNMKAALSRIGADFATPAMKNLRDIFNELRVVFNNVRQALDPVAKIFNVIFTKVTQSLTKELKYLDRAFNKLGMRKQIIEGIAGIVYSLYKRLSAVAKAFKEVFSSPTTAELSGAAQSFRKFGQSLIPSEKELEAITYIFKGLFTVLKYVGEAIKVITILFSRLSPVLMPVIAVVGTLTVLGLVLNKLGNKVAMVVKGLSLLLPVIKAVAVVAAVAGVVLGGMFIGSQIVNNIDKIIDYLNLLRNNIKLTYGAFKANHPVFSKAIDNIKAAGQMAIDKISELFEKIRNIKSFDFSPVTNIFSKIGQEILSVGDWLKTANVLNRIKNTLIKIGTTVKDVFGKIKQSLQDHGIIGSITNIVDRFKELITGVKEVKSESVEVMDEIRGAAGPGGDLVHVILGNDSNVSTGITLLQKIGDALKWVRENLSIGKIAAAAFTVAFFKLLSAIAKGIESFSTVGKAITGFFNTLSGNINKLIGSVTKYLEALAKPKVNPILQFAIAIGILGASVLALMYGMDKLGGPKALWNAVAALIALGAALAIISKVTSAGNFAVFSTGMISIAAGVGILVAALWIMNQVEMEHIIDKAIILVGFMLVLAEVTKIASKFGPGSLKSVLFVLAFAFAVNRIAKALVTLNDMHGSNWKQLLAKAASLALIIGVLAVISVAMSKIKFTGSIGILILCGVISKMLPMLAKAFNNVNIDNLLKTLEKYSTVIVLVALIATMLIMAIGRAGEGIGKVGTAILSFAIAIELLSITVRRLNKFIDETDPQSLNVALAIIGILTLFMLGIAAISALPHTDEGAKKLASTFLSVAASIMVITLAMALLAKVGDDHDIYAAADIMYGLMVLFIAMEIATRFAKKGTVKAIAAAVIGLVIIGAEIIILSLMKWHELIAPIAAVGVVLFGLAQVLKHAGNFKNSDKKSLKLMKTIAVMLGVLGAELIVLSFLPWKQVLAATAGMTGVLLAFSFMLKTISAGSGLGNEKTYKNKIKMMLALAVDLLAIGAALYLASKHNWKQILAAGGAMAGVLVSMGLMAKLLDAIKVNTSAILAITVMAGDILVIGATLSMVADYEWEKILASGAAIAGTLGIMGVVAKLMDAIRVNISAIGAMTVMAFDLLIVGHALQQLAGYDWSEIATAAKWMNGTFIILTACMVVLSKLSAVDIEYAAIATGMIMMSVALVLIAKAFQMMNGLNWDGMQNFLIWFTVFIGIMVVVASIATKLEGLTLALIAIAGAILILGVAALLGGMGMMYVAMALDAMAVPMRFLAEEVGAARILALAGALMVLGIASMMFANPGFLGMQGVAQALVMMSQPLFILKDVDIKTIADGILKLGQSSFVLGAAAGGLTAAAGAIGLLATSMHSLGSALQAIDGKLQEHATTLKQKVITTYQSIGEWISKSIQNGINNNASGPIEAAKTLANKIEEWIRNILDVHSESPTYVGIGGWVPTSLGSGITSKSGAVESAIEGDIGGAVNSGFAKVWEKVKLWAGKIGNAIKSIFSAFKEGGFSAGIAKIGEYGGKLKDYIVQGTQSAMATLGVTDAINDLSKEIEDAVPDVTELTEGMEGLTDGLGSAGGAASSAASDFDNLKSTIEGQMDIFSKFNDETNISAEEMLDNMRSQIAGVSQWAANLQSLALRGMNAGLLKKLGDLGPQGYAKVAAFVQMTDEQLQEANALFAQSLVLPGFAANQVSGSYAYAGQMATQGFLDGINVGQLENGGLEGANAYLNGMKTGLDEHSPSRKTHEIGVYAAQGFEEGFTTRSKLLYNTVGNVCKTIITKFNEILTLDQMRQVGQGMVTGIQEGINQTVDTMGITGAAGLTSFMQAFTYDSGYNVLYEFFTGFKQSINDAFGYEKGESKYILELVEGLLQAIIDTLDNNWTDFNDKLHEKLLDPTQDEFTDGLGYEAMRKFGQMLCDGLVAGIEQNAPRVIAAAEDLARRVNDATSGKNGFNINSPSKVFMYFGKCIDEGLAKGIADNTGMPIRSIGILTDATTSRMNHVISTIGNMLSKDLDMTPTITPVLDTTNIQNGLSNISSMFNSANQNAIMASNGYASMLSAKNAQLNLDRTTSSKLQRDYTQAIIDAVNNSAATDTNLTVVLDGDAGKVFNLVRTENTKFTNATRYNALSMQQV